MGPKEKHAHAQPCFFNSTHKVTPHNGVDVWDPPFSKLNLCCGARNIYTVVLSGQSRLHGQDICQASGEDGRRALRPTSLPSPTGVLPDLPRELLRRRNACSFRALAGSLSLRRQSPVFNSMSNGSENKTATSLCHFLDWPQRESWPSTHWRPYWYGSWPATASPTGNPTSAQQIQDWGSV